MRIYSIFWLFLSLSTNLISQFSDLPKGTVYFSDGERISNVKLGTLFHLCSRSKTNYYSITHNIEKLRYPYTTVCRSVNEFKFDYNEEKYNVGLDHIKEIEFLDAEYELCYVESEWEHPLRTYLKMDDIPNFKLPPLNKKPTPNAAQHLFSKDSAPYFQVDRNLYLTLRPKAFTVKVNFRNGTSVEQKIDAFFFGIRVRYEYDKVKRNPFTDEIVKQENKNINAIFNIGLTLPETGNKGEKLERPKVLTVDFLNQLGELFSNSPKDGQKLLIKKIVFD